MAHALEAFFDDAADAAVRRLWARLDDAGVPSLAVRSHRRHRPHVSFALGGSLPQATRDRLRAELSLLSLPELWLYTLGTFPTAENVLMLAAVVDPELLAVHAAVHDMLAGTVRAPSAYLLPGYWVPHCTLAQGMADAQLVAGFAALHPVGPVRARITAIGVTDTRTGAVDLLLGACRP